MPRECRRKRTKSRTQALSSIWNQKLWIANRSKRTHRSNRPRMSWTPHSAAQSYHDDCRQHDRIRGPWLLRSRPLPSTSEHWKRLQLCSLVQVLELQHSNPWCSYLPTRIPHCIWSWRFLLSLQLFSRLDISFLPQFRYSYSCEEARFSQTFTRSIMDRLQSSQRRWALSLPSHKKWITSDHLSSSK